MKIYVIVRGKSKVFIDATQSETRAKSLVDALNNNPFLKLCHCKYSYFEFTLS